MAENDTSYAEGVHQNFIYWKIFVCLCVFVYVCAFVCVFVYVCAFVCVFVYVCAFVCVCVWMSMVHLLSSK